jgi:hypothetical protein
VFHKGRHRTYISHVPKKERKEENPKFFFFFLLLHSRVTGSSKKRAVHLVTPSFRFVSPSLLPSFPLYFKVLAARNGGALYLIHSHLSR